MGQIKGWVIDYAELTATIQVTITLDGNFLGKVPANIFRQDVNTVYNVIGNHGYSSTVPAAILTDGVVHTVTAKSVSPSGEVLTEVTGQVGPCGRVTAVEVVGFNAQRSGSTVTVRWSALSEFGTAGYQVMKANGRFNGGMPPSAVPVNATLVGATGLGGGYQLIDTAASPRGMVTYWLVEVTSQGTSQVLMKSEVGSTAVYLPMVAAQDTRRTELQREEQPGAYAAR